MVRKAMRVFCMAASLVVWIAAFGPAAALAGPYSRLQVLVPGETAAPGTTTGKTGTPNRQTANVPFSITVRACDSGWNLVPATTNAIEIQASDASATLPAPAQLVGGTATFQVTFNAGGTFTILAHDQTDITIPDGASSSIQTLVLQGFQFAGISQKHKYAGVPDGTTITAIDPSGATVTGFSGQVHLREITSFGDGRITPEWVTFSNGQWSGNVTMYRADESSINRGNVNMYAFLDAAPQKNGTSDPFIVHPGSFARVQLVVPGESPLPGSVSGKVGSPATQGAGRTFVVSVWSTDAYWNPVPSGDNVRLTSSDANDNMPLTGALTNGFRQFSPSLGTVGTQTITVADLTNGSIQGMTSPPIQVIPSDVDHFVVSTITSPQVAGVPVGVTIRATDSNGNTIPGYAGDAVLVANTGAGSIVPEFVTFTAGVWSGPMVFKGAGGAVSFAVADFSAPPHIGSSNNFTVNPGPFTGVQVLLPGQSPRGGTADGKEGNPTPQQAGTAFTLTVRAVDNYWNLVNTVTDSIALGSSDAFAGMPAHTRFTGGQSILPVTLYRTGSQRIWASDITTPAMRPDTSSAVVVSGGPFARLLVLAPGEYPAPGTPSGRAGTATDQSINYAFNVTVLATDTWWNPVGGVTDVVRLTCDDALATLPPDTALVDGRVEMTMRLAAGGYSLITISDVSRPSIPGSTTQVSAISSGFHLEASISQGTARAGEPFTLWVRVTNDAGSVIQEINSAVTLEVKNASTGARGRGLLNPMTFQLLQGQRTVSETYTFVEPIIIIARDDAGNAPATSNSITITPGVPDSIRLDAPTWVGGNTQVRLTATLMDEFGNGVPGQEMVFSRLSGTGTLTRLDSLTVGDGSSRADFLSPRFPEMDRIRAASSGTYGGQSYSVISDVNLETAFVDPNAPGGHVTNYPNPFHPPDEPTTIAYKLSDNATVKLRIFTLSGDLVLARTYERGAPGGLAGLNEVIWDGRNGEDRVVASGGYIALIEAQGVGETLHVIRRKIAVVR